jgi:hypothetical protein
LDAGAWSTIHVLGPPVPSNSGAVAFTDLVTYCEEQLADAGVPADGHSLAMIIVGDGLSLAGGVPSYHWTFDGTDSCMAMEFPSGGFHTLTSHMAHEIAESVTDPGQGSGYAFLGSADAPLFSPWAPAGQTTEAGDICEGEALVEPFEDGGVRYQAIWSNGAAADGGDPCVPARSTPYYSVRSDYNWAAVAAGETVAIPLIGWSTAPIDNWFLDLGYEGSTSPNLSGISPQVTLCTTLGVGQTQWGSYPLMNVGELAQVALTMDPSAMPGDFVTVQIHSFTRDIQDPAFPLDEDYWHDWFVGFYVPAP